MIPLIRNILALVALVVLTACAAKPTSKFKTYNGPPVTQIVVEKGDRQMFLLSGRKVLKAYDIGLGFQPIGHKQFEGDGRTPEGIYYINRQNPNSQYHLSLGISYPDPEDKARAMMLGQQPGGDIMIHGRGAYGAAQKARDWTAGCIAVSDKEIEDIFSMVRPGTPVVIYP
ncbi:L,D-transpeptidase family protein [Paracoccus sanguinis]|uniref:L,D-transpeptidase catalytic domain n=1 Tax=Paracoccus sanguinis TaxID=1545044 RepID=A0A1H3B0A3_9RHOB|nr:L,D-transpeptidase family protein [Paracoccus sanguinis]SDX34834.1 L,D-transpeptidase catalytic domain [Paracoccus sanguinis]